MDFSTWLNQRPGRPAAVAAHFGVSKGAVSQWRKKVPLAKMRAIRDFTDGLVTVEEMVRGAETARRELSRV